MKNPQKYLFALLLFFAGWNAGAQQSLYKGRFHTTPYELNQRGDSLYIGMNVDISQIEIGTYRSLDLIPVLKGQEQEIELPSIKICGRRRYKAYQRAVAFSGNAFTEGGPLVVVRSKRKVPVDYRYAIPFEEWMKAARLEVKEDICGCAGATRQIGRSQITGHISLQEAAVADVQGETPVPPTNIAPPEQPKTLTTEAHVNFPVGKSRILPVYADNSEELNTLQEWIETVRKDKNMTIRRITITGYASPEGTVTLNRQLSRARAVALKEYLAKRYDFPDSLYRIHAGGEDEEGLIREMEKSDMKYKQQLLEMIRNVPATSGREALLRDWKGGEPYREMLKKIYPSLRRATVLVHVEAVNKKQAEDRQK